MRKKTAPEFVDRVKRLAIKAMFSDDQLLQRLVLKGGNLLDVVYGISARASVDVDFSVDGDLGDPEPLRNRIDDTLTKTFADIDYVVFDVRVQLKPTNLSGDMVDFWGGYRVDFKLIETELFNRFADDIASLRRNAASIGGQSSTKFSIDISKHEYVEGKLEHELDDLTIFVYSPAMVICEKLRAICQQMPEYADVVRSHRSARARDFLDIYTVATTQKVDLSLEAIGSTLRFMFDAKRVPIFLLARIEEFRDFHQRDFVAVAATVRPGFDLRSFDEYFDFVAETVAALHPLWDK